MATEISINDARIHGVLNAFRKERAERDEPRPSVLTTEIIDRYMGGFHSNLGVSASVSWNAQFGKYLKTKANELRLVEIEKDVRVVVNGHLTTASRWLL